MDFIKILNNYIFYCVVVVVLVALLLLCRFWNTEGAQYLDRYSSFSFGTDNNTKQGKLPLNNRK